jgi:hypothetical protein
MRQSLAVAGLLGLAACAGIGHPSSPVAVTSTGQELSLSPRDVTCRIEFHTTQRPDRSYDEIAVLHATGTAEASQEKMRRKACDLGADAVIVTADFVSMTHERRITATAVSYPELRERHRAAHRRRVEEWRKVIEGTRRPAGLPSTYVLARTLREVIVTRTTREVLASGQYTKISVPAGQLIWASEHASRGHRLIVTDDAGEGSAAEEALELAPAEALKPAADEPAPEAPRRAAPPRTEI